MTKDKKLLYATSLIIFAVFFSSLFVDLGSSKIVTALLLLPIAPTVCWLIKKRVALSINKKEVLFLLITIASIYAILLHMSGIFFGYYRNPYFVTPGVFTRIVIPLAVIIIGSEIIRYVLLSQKNKLVTVTVFVTCVVIEALMYSNIPGIRTFNQFMDLVGLTLFPAFSANFFYHYVSKNFGPLPNIVFRIITGLYTYFVPTATAMPDALLACIKIIFPILLLAFVSALYAKKQNFAVKRGKKGGAVITVITVMILIASAMLISCKFRFGALVVATESMTGEINKGDMIIYETYKDQNIQEGQVIVFLDNNNRIIHRVVAIERIGNETRYYTKGDANDDWDVGYRTDQDIVGLTDIKLAYVGYPTLWLRDLLRGSD